MNKYLSDRVNNMATSATLAMTAKAKQLKDEGKDIIGLSLGEPDFTIPEFIKDSAVKAIYDNFHSYSPVDGYPDLKRAIINKFKRDNNLSYEPSQIVVSTGAKQSLSNVLMAMLNDGDEVILPTPYWVSYSELVKLSGGVPVDIPTNVKSNFKITAKELEEAITPKTKLLMYSSPCNPSGSIYSKSELESFVEVLEKYPDIYIISDEIYEHINFGGKHVSIAEFPSIYDRTIVINGVSKAFSMTGWRIGYMGAPTWIAKACNKIQGQLTSGANVIAQKATITALEAPVDSIKYMVDSFKKRRDIILEELSNIPGITVNSPEGAFYVFPDISSFFGKTIRGKIISNSDDFSMFLLEEALVATVSGESFGDPNCIRISYAASEDEIIEAMNRIKEVLS